ncbi:MAG: hypothetical protein RTU09_03580 [Candidatus Thorarchaeota archaeon]
MRKWQKDAIFLIFVGPLIVVGIIVFWSITGTWNTTLYSGLLFIALVAAIVLVLFYPDLRKLQAKGTGSTSIKRSRRLKLRTAGTCALTLIYFFLLCLIAA